MQRALEARLSEALRRQEALGVTVSESRSSVPDYLSAPTSVREDVYLEIDAEMEMLKREIGS